MLSQKTHYDNVPGVYKNKQRYLREHALMMYPAEKKKKKKTVNPQNIYP